MYIYICIYVTTILYISYIYIYLYRERETISYTEPICTYLHRPIYIYIYNYHPQLVREHVEVDVGGRALNQ